MAITCRPLDLPHQRPNKLHLPRISVGWARLALYGFMCCIAWSTPARDTHTELSALATTAFLISLFVGRVPSVGTGRINMRFAVSFPSIRMLPHTLLNTFILCDTQRLHEAFPLTLKDFMAYSCCMDLKFDEHRLQTDTTLAW
jgi:hypothetical protein